MAMASLVVVRVSLVVLAVSSSGARQGGQRRRRKGVGGGPQPGDTDPVTRTVVFDEAGNSGPDLLNRDQPVFTLASTSLSPAAAESLVPDSITELKFARLRRSRAGREVVLRVLTDPALNADSVRVIAIHKLFSLVAKMVDLLVEPVAAADGYDLYAHGEHLALSNLIYAALPVIIGEDEAQHLYEGFVGMLREPTRERRMAFVLELGEVAKGAPANVAQLLRLFAAGTVRGEFGDSDLSDLDPAPPCLMALAESWAAAGEPFEILHDDRAELERWKPALALFWEPRAESTTFVLYDGRTITYPLPVAGLEVAASHADLRVQVADVIAGSLQMTLNALAGRCSDEVFADRIKDETPLMDWVIGASVWPTLDFGPDELGARSGATANLADEITAWTRQT
jgi:hypothetical protein